MRGEGGETRGNANDDLRAHPDFLNLVIWLDKSAGEWGPAGGEPKDKWLASTTQNKIVQRHPRSWDPRAPHPSSTARRRAGPRHCTETVDASKCIWNLKESAK